jgi:sulfite reductase (NADPH) flavoprotein alpha-component
MNAVAPPIPLIPENAPFAPAQRAWLNGFLAGLYGGAAQPMSLAPPEVAEKVEDFPWHDPVLELPDRLTLAEGRALPQRLMAAMGQLDCGQCGYMCQTYAAALAEGRESSISLCVPGAKATQLALKRLMAEAPVPASCTHGACTHRSDRPRRARACRRAAHQARFQQGRPPRRRRLAGLRPDIHAG